MDVNDFWKDYECDGQLTIFDYLVEKEEKKMTSQEFDTHLKTESPYNCFTYAFNQEEIKEIKAALDKGTFLEEITKLVKEEGAKDD